MKFKTLFTIATLLTCGAANANLVVNGNFETGSLSSWTASGNVDRTPCNAGPSCYFGGGNMAQDGGYMAGFNSGNSGPNGILSQSFATVAGATYTVSFDYGITAYGQASQSMTASILDGATVIASDVVTGLQSSSPMLTNFRFDFVAASATSTIRFSDFPGNQSWDTDGLLDNVSVAAAVPEPGSVALLALGLLGLAVSNRRYRAGKPG